MYETFLSQAIITHSHVWGPTPGKNHPCASYEIVAVETSSMEVYMLVRSPITQNLCEGSPKMDTYLHTFATIPGKVLTSEKSHIHVKYAGKFSHRDEHMQDPSEPRYLISVNYKLYFQKINIW